MKHAGADALARELARLRGSGLTDAVHFALAEAVAAEKRRGSLPDRVAALARELRAEAEAAGR